jgi:hypothetical protein
LALSAEKLRAWWSYRQGLDGRFDGAKADVVLKETGWARSVGGVGPYFTLNSRAGIRRAEADAGVAKVEIHELPTARGCTYVLPASDFALGLAAGESFRGVEMKTAAKLGVTQTEIEKLGEAILKVLDNAVLSPDEIRDATGNASRSLGEEGKKKGLTTTLPVALGQLQATGNIRRVPIDGRLDQQRYKYTRWHDNPRIGFSMSAEEINVELARRFFKWIGPATLAEFQWFSALGVAVSKKAMEPLNLQPLEPGSDRMILLEQRDEFEAFTIPTEPNYRLISSLDGISLLRRDLRSLIDPADLSRKVFVEKNFEKMELLADLPNHAIVDRGRLVGLWEFDTFTNSLVWLSFIPKNAELIAAVEKMETYVREDLGDARSFSLDSPKSRIPVIESLRAAS